MHVIAAKAVALKEAMEPEFIEYQKTVVENARAMAKVFCDNKVDLVSGGTDNHLLLLDLTRLNITGKAAEELLERVHITVNKNSIPFETRSPFVTSGIRIGTPAVTTRGMKPAQAEIIAGFIVDLLKSPDDKKKETTVKKSGSRPLPQVPPLRPQEKSSLPSKVVIIVTIW